MTQMLINREEMSTFAPTYRWHDYVSDSSDAVSETFPVDEVKAAIDAVVNEWKSFVSRLSSFTKLPDNWDTYHGKAPTHIAVVRALTLVLHWQKIAREQNERLALPHISPCADRSIHMEWSIGRKQVEIAVPSQSQKPFEWVSSIERADGYEDREGTFFKADEAQSQKLVKWLISEK